MTHCACFPMQRYCFADYIRSECAMHVEDLLLFSLHELRAVY